MANVNLMLPTKPAEGSTPTTITLWSTAMTAQSTYQAAVTAYVNGVIADQITAGTTSGSQ